MSHLPHIERREIAAELDLLTCQLARILARNAGRPKIDIRERARVRQQLQRAEKLLGFEALEPLAEAGHEAQLALVKASEDVGFALSIRLPRFSSTRAVIESLTCLAQRLRDHDG